MPPSEMAATTQESGAGTPLSPALAALTYGSALPSGAWDGAVHGSLSSRATRVQLPRMLGARTNARALSQTCMSDADGSDDGRGEAPGVDQVGGVAVLRHETADP